MLPQGVRRKYQYPEILVNAEVYKIQQLLPTHKLLVPAPPEPPVYPYNPNVLLIYPWITGSCLVLYAVVQDVYIIAWVLALSLVSSVLIKVRFRFALDKYHAARAYAAAYQVRVAEYSKQLNELFPTEKLWNYRLALLKQYFSTAKQPENRTTDDEHYPNKRKAEVIFYNYLALYFGKNIYVDKKVQVTNAGKYSINYYPDFVYQDETGLCIDIEIDEPYDAESSKPTHCVGIDDERNNFFVENKWVVIRFSEEQVVEWPELCCKEIALTVFDINRISYTAKEITGSLPPQKKWTAYEAKLLANKAFSQSLIV